MEVESQVVVFDDAPKLMVASAGGEVVLGTRTG
jgi:hypothetical protein